MNGSRTTQTVSIARAPGQGTSRKARARRNRRQETKTTITTNTNTTSQPRKQNKKKTKKGGGGGRNPYLNSLLFPENGAGVKVPDSFTLIPTGTFQLTTDFALPTIADSTYGNIGGIYLDIAGGKYGVVTYNSTLVWQAIDMPGLATANAIFKSRRVVSACVMTTYIGSTMDDQGTVCLFSIADNGGAPSAKPNDNWTLPYSKILPARQMTKVCYRPSDNEDIEFHSGSELAGTSGHVGFIGNYFQGMSKTGTILVKVVINYEGIPASDTTNFVNASNSPRNKGWMEQTADYLSQVPMLASFGASAISAYASYNSIQNGGRNNRQVEWI